MKTAYLKGLESATANNRTLKRAVGCFCVLKTYEKSGYIALTRYADCAALLGITTRTFYARINQMQAAGLITANRKGISLRSWHTVAQLFSINETKFYYVPGTTRPDLTLTALFIRSRQLACEAAFLRKVNKDTELKQHLQKVTGLQTSDKGFAAAVYKYQLLATLLNKKGEIITLNANTTPGYKNLSDLLGYNSRGGLAYLKRKLQKAELLTVEKREYTTTPHVYGSVMGNVYYRRPLQQRRLQLTDTFKF